MTSIDFNQLSFTNIPEHKATDHTQWYIWTRRIGGSLVALALLLWTLSLIPNVYVISNSSIGTILENHGNDNPKKLLFSVEESKGILLKNLNKQAFSENMVSKRQLILGLNSISHDKYFKESLATAIQRKNGVGLFWNNQHIWVPLVWMLFFIGAILNLVPRFFEGEPGIKNHGVFQKQSTARGLIAWGFCLWLITFYVGLYFFPHYIVEMISFTDYPASFLTGNQASQWFMYGLIYTIIMWFMGMRMFAKYRHSTYHKIRTGSILFFQTVFAFLLPEIMVWFKLPWVDLKNAWPLNYSLFYDYNIKNFLNAGFWGQSIFVWLVVFSFIAVPVITYYFGKRWYCSWVCGCGGLAETLGDPFRQLSDKSTSAWKVERWLIHSVLVFAVFMTIGLWWTWKENWQTFMWMNVNTIKTWYGFLIVSLFSGVLGTGLYPIFGNRVWCRFGCPLAAVMGIVQRFKSRFRITTNGGQCISCGNCSTYCEMGIDVRSYAQRGENIVRASCVGCGVCSAVCPRGVLTLENGPSENRFINNNQGTLRIL